MSADLAARLLRGLRRTWREFERLLFVPGRGWEFPTAHYPSLDEPDDFETWIRDDSLDTFGEWLAARTVARADALNVTPPPAALRRMRDAGASRHEACAALSAFSAFRFDEAPLVLRDQDGTELLRVGPPDRVDAARGWTTHFPDIPEPIDPPRRIILDFDRGARGKRLPS